MAHIEWKTYGEKGANAEAERWHLPFKLVLLLLRANEQYGLGVFLEFHYLRVSINTLLCSALIWDIVKVFFLVSVDVGNLPNHIKSVCFSFRFSLIFTKNCCTKINSHFGIFHLYVGFLELTWLPLALGYRVLQSHSLERFYAIRNRIKMPTSKL